MDKYTNRISIEDQKGLTKLSIDEIEIEQDEQKERMRSAIKAAIAWETQNRKSSNKMNNALFKQLKEAIK